MKTSTASHASVPSGKGLKVEKSVTIALPPQQVYAFWRRFENLSRFLRHVESVTERPDGTSHWVIRTHGDNTLEWDARLIEDRPGELISWQSLPEADVDNAGSVWFTPGSDGRGTTLKVALKYDPPAGRLGAAVAKLFGHDAESQIDEDLLRLKELLESGETASAVHRSGGHDSSQDA